MEDTWCKFQLFASILAQNKTQPSLRGGASLRVFSLVAFSNSSVDSVLNLKPVFSLVAFSDSSVDSVLKLKSVFSLVAFSDS